MSIITHLEEDSYRDSSFDTLTINKYYLKYGWMLAIGIFALAMVDYAQLKIPEYYRLMINGMNGQFVLDLDFLLDKICLPMIVIILMIVTGRFLWRMFLYGAGILVERDIRDEMFDHCKDLSQQYYQVNKVGDLMSLFTNDLETVQDCFGNGILMLFDAAVLGFMALYKMFRMSPQMTLLALIPMVIMFLLASKVAQLMNERWTSRQEAFSLLSDYAQESFSGIAVIKAFAKELSELGAFRKLNKHNEDANIAYTRVSTLLDVLISLTVESIVCFILGYGGYLVYKGVFDPGMLVEFIGYFTSVVWPIIAIGMLVEMFSKGKASLARISNLLDAPIDVRDSEAAMPSAVSESGVSRSARPDASAATSGSALLRGDIEFRHLNFTYPGSDREVLHDVSFHIHAGENIGILGRTGTGKTTLVDLLARIYNVEDGTLFVDGKDVNTIPIRTLRDAIAYVPQDSFLFSDTIAGNIAFSLESADDIQLESRMKSIVAAARMADIHDNISEFPEQYQTVLGERGVTVSGGQKQRISIARALLKDASILILDDSVSAVDTRTERMILDNLHRLREGMTTLLIAHRISTIEQMDRILFIDDGEVIDFGTHDELLIRCPAYAEMVARQQLEEERSAQEASSRMVEDESHVPKASGRKSEAADPGQNKANGKEGRQ